MTKTAVTWWTFSWDAGANFLFKCWPITDLCFYYDDRWDAGPQFYTTLFPFATWYATLTPVLDTLKFCPGTVHWNVKRSTQGKDTPFKQGKDTPFKLNCISIFTYTDMQTTKYISYILEMWKKVQFFGFIYFGFLCVLADDWFNIVSIFNITQRPTRTVLFITLSSLCVMFWAFTNIASLWFWRVGTCSILCSVLLSTSTSLTASTPFAKGPKRTPKAINCSYQFLFNIILQTVSKKLKSAILYFIF